ncbi:hypothetical protein DYB32_005568, partial [Aphanomyces invadans]
HQDTTAFGLAAVPPSSDPHRLLSYVLSIMPQYTSMELSSTHFRLYNQHLRRELDQVRQSLEFMQERAHDEEEKRMFVEKYASEVVKERNELLHHKGKKTHKLWHNCCRKYASYDLDVTPSITSLRGEKLTEMTLQLKQNVQALHEKDRLLQTAQHLSEGAVRDRIVVATRTDQTCLPVRDHLHEYIAQISGLHTAQERQLYEAQSQLAVEVQANEKSHGEIDDLHQRLDELEALVENQRNELAEKDCQVDQLKQLVKVASNAAAVERQLQEECRRLAQPGRDAEIEALQSQVEALQTADVQQLTRKYTKHIQLLQDQLDKQNRTIDRLEQELHHFRPMTLDDMTDSHNAPSLASSWHDSFGTISRRSSIAADLPPDPSVLLHESHEPSRSSSTPNDSECFHPTTDSSDDGRIDRDGILKQLQLLVEESDRRRKAEEAQARLDQDVLGHVLITGGSRGIGKMMAEGFVRNGAKVYISARSDKVCQETAAELSAMGATSPGQGVAWGGGFDTHNAKAWSKVMDLNVTAPFFLTKFMLPLLQTHARVIMIGSIAGLQPQDLGTLAYDTSKAAIHHMTRALAVQLAPKQITVNCIAPGLVPTKMSKQIATATGKECGKHLPQFFLT